MHATIIAVTPLLPDFLSLLCKAYLALLIKDLTFCKLYGSLRSPYLSCIHFTFLLQRATSSLHHHHCITDVSITGMRCEKYSGQARDILRTPQCWILELYRCAALPPGLWVLYCGVNLCGSH